MLYYKGPKLKKLKHLNTYVLPGFSNKYIKKCNFLIDKTMTSFYLYDLLEKQKLKYTFLLTERKIRRYLFHKNIFRKRDELNIINLRLEVVLFKIGFFKTIKQSRQCIIHGFILVNYIKITEPDFLVRKGDIITLFSLSSLFIKTYRKNFLEYNLDSRNINNTLLYEKDSVLLLSLYNLYYNYIQYDLSAVQKYYFV